MNTSYFAKYKGTIGVSISAKAPTWWSGREYKKLAPKYWFFMKYKEDGDEEFYTKAYQEEVLDKLDAQEVYNELGSDVVLLCYEKSNTFCHRHLVANWLNEKLNLKITEL